MSRLTIDYFFRAASTFSGRAGQMPHAGAASLIDGIDDGGMWSGERKLAHAGCAERAVLAGVFEVDQLDVVRDVLDVGQTGAQ